jgi:hypothetical protein
MSYTVYFRAVKCGKDRLAQFIQTVIEILRKTVDRRPNKTWPAN